MPRKPRLYQRLTRPRTGLGTYSSLWMAADHLLEVTSSGVHESYARFYFRDIRGFFTRKTRVYTHANLIAGCIALIGGLVVGQGFYRPSTTGSGEGIILGILLLVPAGLVLIVNLVRGPSCKVTVVTGLQQPVVRSLSRRRKLAKVMRRIEPLIREAQRDMVPRAAPTDEQTAPPLEPPLSSS